MRSENHFRLETMIAFGTLLFSAIGMYFTFRWITTVSTVDQKTRDLLLGEMLATYFNSVKMLQFLGVLFLSYSFFNMMITAAKWKRRLEVSHTNLLAVKSE